jgi:hypothetical protein
MPWHPQALYRWPLGTLAAASWNQVATVAGASLSPHLVYLSVCLSICLSVYLFVTLSAHLQTVPWHRLAMALVLSPGWRAVVRL